MVDHTSKVTLTGEDKTGAMYKSAKKNADDYIKSLEKILEINKSQSRILQSQAVQQHRTYQSMLETILKNNKAYNENLKRIQDLGKGAEDGANKQVTAAQKINNAIGGVIRSHLSWAAAAEAARRSYLGFADAENKMLLLQNATKATTASIQASEKAIREVSQTSQTGFDETLTAANKLRQGLNITLDQAIAKTTRLNVVAAGMGVGPTEFASAITNFMRNMNIPADQFNQTMEMMAGIVRETNVDIKDLVSNSGELGEAAKAAGYSGRDGFARMGAQLGIATDLMGDTSKGARLLTQTFQKLGSESVGEAFGTPGKIWIEQVEEVKREGGDLAAFVVGKFKGLRTEQEKASFLRKLENKERLLFSKLVEKDNGSIAAQIKLFKDLADGQQAINDGKNVMAGAQGGINSMSAAVKNLSDQFGALMKTLGVPQIINMFASELESLGKVVAWVGNAIDWARGKEGATRPSIVGPHGFHPLAPLANGGRSLGRGVVGGLSGEQATEDAKKKLDDALKKDDPNYKPIGFREDAVDAAQRSAAWVAGKVYEQQDKRPRAPVSGSGMGIRGALPGGATNVNYTGGYSGYGGSSDSAYLPADYRNNALLQRASLGGPGGGGGGGGGGFSQFSPAGPQGYGGGTGYGGQGNVPRSSAQSSGQSSRPPAETTDEAVTGAQEGGLAADRAKFKAEMDANPALRDKVLRIAANEQGKHGQGTQAVIESMMNRASHRGRTLAQEARWTGEGGYYEQGNMGRGALENPEHRKILESSLDKTLAGGNVSDFATDNASQGLAAKRKANQEMEWTKDYGGESFFRPGRVSGSGNVQTHRRWMERMRAGDADPTVARGSRVPRPGETSAEIAGGDWVKEDQGKVAGIRKGRLSEETRTFLQAAGQEHGLRADVYSGGQRMHGAPGATGSHRHDQGGAGDFKLWDPKAKRYLDSRKPEDAARMEAYTASAVKYGATGVGHGHGYMGSQSIHIGGGSHASWGGSGWIERARRTGMAARGPGGQPVAPPVAAAPAPAAPTASAVEEPKGEGALQQQSRDQQQQVNLKLNVNDNDVQFARSSMRRGADREVREARWNSYSDIGAA